MNQLAICKAQLEDLSVEQNFKNSNKCAAHDECTVEAENAFLAHANFLSNNPLTHVRLVLTCSENLR